MDQADSRQGSLPILFNQSSRTLQDESNLPHWNDEIFSQITPDVLVQGGSRALIDNAFQTNGHFTPPQSNYNVDFSNHLLLQQSLNARDPTDYRHISNDHKIFLLNDDLRTNEYPTVSLPHQQSSLKDFLDYTLSEQSVNAVAWSQVSYPFNNQLSSLADHGNALQLPPSFDVNYLWYLPCTLEQSASATQCSSPTNNQTLLALVDGTGRPASSAPPQPGHVEGFLDYTLDNTVHLSPLGSFSNHTLDQSAGIAAHSHSLYMAKNPQIILADLGNAHRTSPRSQTSCHEALDENVGHSIIIPLSLALAEHQEPAPNFEQYPVPGLLQPKIKQHDIALVEQSLAVNRRQTPCIGCRLRKIKCQKPSPSIAGSRCVRCVKQHIPQQVCIQLRVTDYKVFEKWQNEIYETQFTLVRSSDSSSRRTAELEHYSNGPSLLVECCEFRPTEHYQIEAVRKNSAGLHIAKTTAFCLVNSRIDISLYVKKCTRYAIQEACKRQDIVSIFFKLAYSYYRDKPIIQRCFEMYTALRLMMKGCQFSGKRKMRTGLEDDYLGMAKIEDPNSAWFGCIPVPRMVKNQVNHRLELRMKELDGEILKDADNLLQTKQQHVWVVSTLATFLVLHIRELDAGRNIFWKRYEDPLGFWIHPSKPQVLIEEAIASSNSLLSHYHYRFGRKPLDMNWDEQKSKDVVNNDKKFIKTVKVLQSYVSELMGKDMVGRKACDLYEAGNPKSVDFTASSLLFVKNLSEGCEVKGFY